MTTRMQQTGRVLVLALATSGVCVAAAEGTWAVRDAPIRFVADVTRTPTHPSAGYFVNLPDGGILPGPYPEMVVLDASGKPLTSAVLWHSKDTACALVVAAPTAGSEIVVYVRGSRTWTTWKPESGLTPSALLCEVNGANTRSAALKLGRFGSVDARHTFRNQSWSAGYWDNQNVPLALSEWKTGVNALYLLAYLDVQDPGSTWFAPFRRSGEMELVVDGKRVAFAKKNEKLGGYGGSVDLSAGLHRVELFGFSDPGQAVGPMMLTWRTPKTTLEELGGARPNDLRYPGTPMCESCMIDEARVVKSGECKLRAIQSRDGVVAAFTHAADRLYAFEGETPLIATTLQAWTKGNPSDTRYTWQFEDAPNATAEGAAVHWLFKGFRHGRVTLTVEAGGKRATCSRVLYFHTSESSSLDDEETRQRFKQAAFTMLKAYPAAVDPMAVWDDALLNNFFRVLDITGANALLEYIVTQRWPFFKKKLTVERQTLLEDIFLFSLAPRKPREAMQWAMKLSADEFSGGRSAVLKLKAAEMLMYYLDDLDGAGKIIAPLLRESGEAGEWAKIRMGDLAFLSRDLAAATQRYGDVQNRAKAHAATLAPTRLTLFPSGVSRARRSKEARDAAQADPMSQPANLPSWKLSAIRDVAASEKVNTLISQGYYLEAFQAMQSWERIFPMSKISGDYLLCEAKLYRALRDFKRARVLLGAYCDQVDASNFLVEAMELNRQCMIDLKEPAEVIDAFTENIRKRAFFGGGE